MPGVKERSSVTVGRLLKWLQSLAEEGVILDEYELFLRTAKTTPEIQQRVSEALELTSAPELATLTREQYNALTPSQLEAALEQLLAILGLTLEAARQLFCVKLKWCERKSGWRQFRDRLLGKVPLRLRGLVRLVSNAVPFTWDAIKILRHLHPSAEFVILGVRFSAYLASGALDKLCRC